jgi:hypothetical protein
MRRSVSIFETTRFSVLYFLLCKSGNLDFTSSTQVNNGVIGVYDEAYKFLNSAQNRHVADTFFEHFSRDGSIILVFCNVI